MIWEIISSCLKFYIVEATEDSLKFGNPPPKTAKLRKCKKKVEKEFERFAYSSARVIWTGQTGLSGAKMQKHQKCTMGIHRTILKSNIGKRKRLEV